MTPILEEPDSRLEVVPFPFGELVEETATHVEQPFEFLLRQMPLQIAQNITIVCSAQMANQQSLAQCFMIQTPMPGLDYRRLQYGNYPVIIQFLINCPMAIASGDVQYINNKGRLSLQPT